MPRKKKTNLSQYTKKSKRVKTTRNLENDNDQEASLALSRDYKKRLRKFDSSSESESNSTSQRVQTSVSRRRGLKTNLSRYTKESKRVKMNRNIENDNDREARLALNRDYKKRLRKFDTTPERESNPISQRVQPSVSRRRGTSNEYRMPLRELDNQAQLPEKRPWLDKEKSGFSYKHNIDYTKYANIGSMNIICTYCQALKWSKETKGMCCSGGKVQLDLFNAPPEPMKSLLTGNHPHSQHFLNSIRSYNSAFAMTSFGAKQISEGAFMPTFKIQGQVYHLIGSMFPTNEPKFLQVYFISDYQEQMNQRTQNIPNIRTDIVNELQSMLQETNSYVKSFKAALENVPHNQQNNYKFVISADKRPAASHRGRYNAPTTNEVAVLLVDQECGKRDIILRTRDDQLRRISETHRAYDALQYPLIYCRGEDGYNFSVYNVDPETKAPDFAKKTTALQFYSYVLQIRYEQFIHLQRFRALFSQYMVDMYAKIETERLVFIRTNQKKLRAENYIDLRDALQQDSNTENIGRLVILPSSFIGGPRYMHERTQDAFCYVRKYGKPDFFITITTNPKWIEIMKELNKGEVPHDRHDIVTRVFHLKLKLFIDLLTKENVFGEVLCFIYTIEWQKRGLPHAHLLLWLKDKLRTDDIDNVIRAELPDPHEDLELYNIIKTHMVHGPCGTLNVNSPCMANGHCTKKYPKSFIDRTITERDGYPLYRRRSPEQGGFSAEVTVNRAKVIIDNRWIVPYSPVLSKALQAHINVEACNSVNSIKYICKYVNKGSDQATFALKNNSDEITKYQSGRYICSSEAAWRIFSFPIHERYPPVIHLDVHVEGGQRIYFTSDNVRQRLENPKSTTLTAFFKLCEIDDFAKTLFYEEIPSYYTFDKQRGVFNRRKRGVEVENFPGVFKEHVIGRVYTVHPNNSECFYLRLLLYNVRGPTSFAALRTVNEIEYPTFQAACRARRLLEDDRQWDEAMAEACVSDSPHRLRNLFSILLIFCEVANAAELWEKYRNYLAEDFLHNLRLNSGENHDQLQDIAFNRCLLAIQEIVTSIGGNQLIHYGLPAPDEQLGSIYTNREYTLETNYDRVEMANFVRDNISKLTNEQRLIFDRVCQSVDSQSKEVFFLDAPGGTGKTFLTKIILAHQRSKGKIALAVASSGIAATLLPGGKTAHTMFKIPVQLDTSETPVCDISRSSAKATVLRECSLIIWDECTMAHRRALEAVDRTVRDIRQCDKLLGGITTLFCGDFRQTLPVIPRGTRADEVNACLKNSSIWHRVVKLHLSVNMRARIGGNPQAQLFSNLLLQIGEGIFPQVNGEISLPETLCTTVASQEELITSVFGNVDEVTNHGNSWLCERAILTPRNDHVTHINSVILKRIETESFEYASINRVVDQDEVTNYPIEFLNSLSAPGVPAHIIVVKVGVPIILLRNLNPPKLCNGTRLKVTKLQPNVIEAEVLTGPAAGESVFIPRIPLIPNNYPFRFKRIQFPVSVCFAMTINKAQGQTLQTAGVDLSTDCFSHGQLYVACSRVSEAQRLFVYTPRENRTVNVVYKEALE